MKAKELRIGNFYLDINDSLTEISGYELHQMTIKENKGDLGIMEFQPIPLTEEWLLKFGFEVEEMRNGYQYTLNGFCLWNSLDSECYSFMIGNDRNDMNIFDIELKCLHKLQNLYFALTNTELVCQ